MDWLFFWRNHRIVGGIAGYSQGEIKNANVEATIKGTTSRTGNIGGIVGNSRDTIKIYNCYANVKIYGGFYSENGNRAAGGIIGSNRHSGSEIKNCAYVNEIENMQNIQYIRRLGWTKSNKNTYRILLYEWKITINK